MLQATFNAQIGGRGNIFAAFATVTAPPAYTTAAGTGGPLLWNGSAVAGGKGVTAFLLGVSFAVTTASTVAGTLGVGGAGGQVAAPTSTTAIGVAGNLTVGGPSPQCSVYSTGTVTNAASAFLTLAEVTIGTLTNTGIFPNWIDLGAGVQVPVGTWASALASAALTTGVFQIGLAWLELPNT